jgi:hypothetical protein
VKFIEVVLNGGLGNQLFQYATARALMKKSDFLFFNVNSYRDDYLEREFKLLNYNVKGSVTKNIFLQKAFIPNTKINMCLSQLSLYSLIKENGFFIHNELIQKTKIFTRILGFWQSELYFNTFRNVLLSEMKPRVIPTLPQVFKFPNTVAVHVRRSDYLTDLRYGFIGEDYYWNAIHHMKLKVVNPIFVFFSDDMEWCRSTFKQNSMFFSDEFDLNEDYIQLYLMSKCKHQIIANSSFSWWSAWLNEYPNKLVIRPIKPFNDSSLLYENYYPLNWIAL